MKSREEKRWELMQEALAAEAAGKSPRLFASQRTLFGIPSALDEELARFAGQGNEAGAHGSRPEPPRAGKPCRIACDMTPVYDRASRVLLLGAMPSAPSREVGFPHSRPDDRFWEVLAALFDATPPYDADGRRAFLLDRGIALWYVLAECVIEGERRGSLAECVPNPIGTVLSRAPIRAVFCTGARATELYARHCQEATGVAAYELPSTGSESAGIPLARLVDAYRAVLPYLE